MSFRSRRDGSHYPVGSQGSKIQYIDFRTGDIEPVSNARASVEWLEKEWTNDNVDRGDLLHSAKTARDNSTGEVRQLYSDWIDSHRRPDHPRALGPKVYNDNAVLYNHNGLDYLTLIADDEKKYVNQERVNSDMKQVSDIISKIPESDRKYIGFVVLNYGSSSAEGKPLREFLPSEAFDLMGDKEARAFLRKEIKAGRGNGLEIDPVWSQESHERRVHVIDHEVGHLVYPERSLEDREKVIQDYQSKINKVLEDTRIKSQVERVSRLEDGTIFEVRGPYVSHFDKRLWQDYGFPSEYSTKNESEYFAEVYANRLEGNI